MIITGIEVCCHHKLMLPCSKKVSKLKHQKPKISWYQKNGKMKVKEEDEMKVTLMKLK